MIYNKLHITLYRVRRRGRLYRRRIGVSHVKDGTKGFGASALLGTGTTRFFEQIDFLKEKNYKGWLIIENLYELLPMRELNPDYYEMMAEDIRTLKKVAGR